ncbi:hypothetical protein FHX08_001505 [Rhizobium sp. BK529]|nr:hypothetical protein [Rhizobium sp. BK529]TCS08884.1 hypothetical protein EV281_101762 [Rhizobium sp. BK418]
MTAAIENPTPMAIGTAGKNIAALEERDRIQRESGEGGETAENRVCGILTIQ